MKHEEKKEITITYELFWNKTDPTHRHWTYLSNELPNGFKKLCNAYYGMAYVLEAYYDAETDVIVIETTNPICEFITNFCSMFEMDLKKKTTTIEEWP